MKLITVSLFYKDQTPISNTTCIQMIGLIKKSPRIVVLVFLEATVIKTFWKQTVNIFTTVEKLAVLPSYWNWCMSQTIQLLWADLTAVIVIFKPPSNWKSKCSSLFESNRFWFKSFNAFESAHRTFSLSPPWQFQVVWLQPTFLHSDCVAQR